MKRIIITAILAAICTVGGATSFVMNDLPSYTAWKQDNAQQFKKTPKYDGIDQQKDKYYDNDKDYKKVNDHKDDKDHKDYKNKKDKKDKKDKKAMSKAHKHARELAVKHNMTNRAALPEKDREMIKHGNILSDKIAR